MKLGVDQDNQKRVAGLEKQSCRFLQVGCRFLKVFSERRHKAVGFEMKQLKWFFQ